MTDLINFFPTILLGLMLALTLILLPLLNEEAPPRRDTGEAEGRRSREVTH